MGALRDLLNQFGALFRWWYTVAPWEQSVRVRLGKYVEVLGKGVHLRIPFIDVVYRQSTRHRFTNTGVQTLTTRDGITVTLAGELAYSIQDIGLLYDTLHHAEETLTSEVRALVANYVATSTRETCTPELLMRAVNKDMNLTRYGLASQGFYISTFALVKTYRLIQGEPRDWSIGDSLDTNRPEGRQD